MNPQVPGYQTGAPPAWGAGAPAGTTIVAPPAYAPPQLPATYPHPAPPKASRRGWIAVWTMFIVALLLAATAAGLSIANLTRNTAATTTVTAAPPAAPTPSNFAPGQAAAAKKEVCAASINVDKAITAAQRNFFGAAHDRQSPEYRPALGNFQLVAAIETAFLERQLTPAVPKDVTDATNGYIAATLALVDANTRELSDQDAQAFVVAARDSGEQLDKVCE
jgi:hypothetical protein